MGRSSLTNGSTAEQIERGELTTSTPNSEHRSAATSVAVRLLGPMELTIEGVEQPLGGPRQRAVLALLALEPNRTIAVDRIIVELWDDDRLKQPRNNVQVYISNLRRLVRGHDAEIAIVGDGAGYRLHVAEGVIDHDTFTRTLTDAGRQLDRGLAEGAARTAAAALAMWRGPFLDDMATRFDVFSAAANRAHEQLMLASDLWITAELEAGRSGELVPHLEQLVTTHPLHERFWVQLMTALARAGRQSDALRTYQRARNTLADEAGLDPGPELRALEAALLGGDLPAVAPVAASQGMLLLYADASGAPQRVVLGADGSFTIGRHTGVDVPIEWDARASRTHARLDVTASGLMLSDCGSTNGTFVGGRRLDAPVELRTGDVFVVGSTAFTLRTIGDSQGFAWTPSEVTMIEPSRQVAE